MKRKFIVNPGAARGRAARRLGELEEYFRKAGGGFDAISCESRARAIEETARALREGYGQIVALGGDGTINAVANGFFDQELKLINPEAALAVGPWGSGCDYFRSLGIAERAWRSVVLEPRVCRVDVIACEDRAGAPRGIFVNSASLGVGAEIVALRGGLPRWVPRTWSYALPTLRKLPRLRAFSAQVELDGERFEGEFVAIFLSKGRYAGGGMRFGSKVELDDGGLELTLFGALELSTIVRNLPRLFTGGLERVPGIRKTRASSVRITTPKAVPWELDGELPERAPHSFRILPGALGVCFPSVP
jgi:diacylglycerol kinase (ATP)